MNEVFYFLFLPVIYFGLTFTRLNFAPKVSKIFIILGKITKITPISLYYDPPNYDLSNEVFSKLDGKLEAVVENGCQKKGNFDN